jgi:hypothetical protein
MGDIFKIIMGLLTGIDGVAWVDKDNKQLDIFDTKPAVPFPCILIRVSIPLTETAGPGIQVCTGQVIIRIASDLSVSETSSKAPQAALDRSLAYFNLVDAVYNKLQGYADNYIQNLERVSSMEEDRRDGLTVVKTSFSVIFEETVAS